MKRPPPSRLIRSLFLVLVLLAVVWVRAGRPSPEDCFGIIRDRIEILAAGNDSFTPDQCSAELMTGVNKQRAVQRLPMLQPDPTLNKWLEDASATIKATDLGAVTALMRDGLPLYVRANVSSAASLRLRDLSTHFSDAFAQMSPTVNSVGTLVRKRASGYGFEAVLVLAQKVVPFTPEEIKSTSDEITYYTCPHCKHTETYRTQPRDGGYDLFCPACKLSGGVVATDALGTYRYANEFLVGYQPPAVYPSNMTRELEMFIIWNAVNSGCKYRRDNEDSRQTRDVWQLPLETMVRGEGDCEDTSLLLADWLISRGFNARVALGRAMGVGHAWVVVRLDGVEYLLESTNASPDLNVLPLAKKVGRGYQPDTLFDREHIYVQSAPTREFDGTYWSEQNWIMLKPRERKDLANMKTPVTIAAGPKPIMAVSDTKSIELQVSGKTMPKLSRLGEVPVSADIWQLMTPFAKSQP